MKSLLCVSKAVANWFLLWYHNYYHVKITLVLRFKSHFYCQYQAPPRILLSMCIMLILRSIMVAGLATLVQKKAICGSRIKPNYDYSRVKTNIAPGLINIIKFTVDVYREWKCNLDLAQSHRGIYGGFGFIYHIYIL